MSEQKAGDELQALGDALQSRRLQGRIAIVTGGARGIGRSIVERLVADGARVAFTYNSSPGPAEEIVAALGDERVMAIKCDVASAEDIQNLVEKVTSSWGKIHILVNNAGITRDNLVMRMSQSDFEDVLSTNLTSAFLASKAVMRPMMSERWGRIISIASVVALVGNPGQANYVASKAGLIGLTKSIAREVASRNILVNCIAPGFIQTDMTSKLNEAQQGELLTQVPLKRAGRAEDIASMVSFLASDDASYITGQVFAVDGGMTMV
jgi:3-oxoacyl-[acyl-carrier protein] reductase